MLLIYNIVNLTCKDFYYIVLYIFYLLQSMLLIYYLPMQTNVDFFINKLFHVFVYSLKSYLEIVRATSNISRYLARIAKPAAVVISFLL